MGNRLYNIEFGTFVTKSNKTQISISKELFNKMQLSELRYTFEHLQDNNSFLGIESIEEEDNTFIFTYEVDTNEYKNLKNIKSENIAVRFAVASAILKQNIGETFSGYVSLYPSNIWYKPLSEIRYAYRGSYEMTATDSATNLVRYKALMLYILIGYPFEKALKQEYKLSEGKYPFAVQIINAQSINEVSSLLDHKRDELIYQSIQRGKRSKGKSKMVIAIAVMFLLILDVIGIGLAKNNLKVSADEELQGQLTAVSEELEETKGELNTLVYNASLDTAITDGDFEETGTLMLNGGSSNAEIASFMFENSQYNLALKYNENLLEQIIQAIYNSGDVERINDLSLDSDNETLNQKLRLEQAVVSHDTAVLDPEWALTEDRHTLTRVAEAYINHGNIETAKTILKKAESSQYLEEFAYIEALLKVKENETALQNAESILNEVRELPDDSEDKGSRLQEAENTVATCQETITVATTGLQEAEATLRETWTNEEDS